MKLNTRYLRYLSAEDWRILTAVEIGSKNHEVVPTTLIIQLSNLRGGSGVHKCISTLAKANLIARVQNARYDGYRLTYGGLDYLALHTHLKRSVLYSTGPCIGTGKESDIYICAAPPTKAQDKMSTGTSVPSTNGKSRGFVIKLHRLGRISFRTIKKNRDYLRHRSSASWMYMSRLSAQKEFAFMQALYAAGHRVPEPIAWSRHTVVMSLIEDSVPLRAVKHVGDPAALYDELMNMIFRLAEHGLIHGDFNEFNILVKDEPMPPEHQENNSETIDDSSIHSAESTPVKAVPYMIDFPQAVSIDHANAEFYFNRDVNCIKTFFARRFQFESQSTGPTFAEARKCAGDVSATAKTKSKKSTKTQMTHGEEVAETEAQARIALPTRLDIAVEASGFSRKMAKELEKYMEELEQRGSDLDDEEEDDEEEEEEEDEEEDENEYEDDQEHYDGEQHEGEARLQLSGDEAGGSKA